MRAIRRTRYGSPDTLELREIDIPEPTDEQVLVRVLASSVNAHDWHMLRGHPYLVRLSDGLRRPKADLIGIDVAGVVEAVGADVGDLRVGDRVFGSRWGAFAEYVAGKTMAPMPSTLSAEEAAALPTAGFTALQGLRDKGQLQRGERLLVVGAGGGVGHLAVQIGKALEAEVSALTGPRTVEMVGRVGADEVLDYTREELRRHAGRFDLVLDVGGTRSLGALRRLLTPAGRIVMVAPAPGNWLGPVLRMAMAGVSTRLGRRPAIGYLASPNRDDLLALKQMAESGKLRPVVDRVFPLAEAAAAIRHVEEGRAAGKVVVRVGQNTGPSAPSPKSPFTPPSG